MTNQKSTKRMLAGSILPLLATLMVLFTIGLTEAAASTYYVWEGASGSNNGTSWSNAWTSISSASAISAGDTVYIAAGQYGGLSCSDANASYLRATANDHGSDSGWSNSMDGLVHITGAIDINANGVTVDGRTAYGIKVTGGSANGAIDIYGNYGNVTVKYMELDGSAEPGGPCSWRGMRVAGASGSAPVANLTISNIYMHNYYNDCIKWINVKDSVIEYTTFGARSGSCSEHGDAMEIFGISSNITIRYCDYNWNGQQIFFGAASTSNNWQIYGNVFRNGTSASGVGIHPKAQSDTTGSITLYNNTFYNMNRAHDLTAYYSGTAKNNLYYSTGTMSYGGLSSSNNTVMSSNPFVGASSGNFRLASATAGGDNSLSSQFGVDPDGKTRGADGTWDLGAYEFGPGGGGTVPTPTPEPTPTVVPNPSGLRLATATTDGQQITQMTVSASSNDGNVPQNTIDDDFSTRWSASGSGQWVQYDFGAAKCLSYVMTAFYQGDSRTASFSMETSNDGSNWNQVFNGSSSGTTAQQERYDLAEGSTGRYLRITGYGNNVNSWNSITEVDIYQCGS